MMLLLLEFCIFGLSQCVSPEVGDAVTQLVTWVGNLPLL